MTEFNALCTPRALWIFWNSWMFAFVIAMLSAYDVVGNELPDGKYACISNQSYAIVTRDSETQIGPTNPKIFKFFVDIKKNAFEKVDCQYDENAQTLLDWFSYSLSCNAKQMLTITSSAWFNGISFGDGNRFYNATSMISIMDSKMDHFLIQKTVSMPYNNSVTDQYTIIGECEKF